AQAGLELRDIQAAYGPLGPERKSLDVYPGDEVLFRFTVNGARLGKNGRTDGEMALQLANASGKVVFEKKDDVQAMLGLGGDSFPAHTVIKLGDQVPAGDYTLTATLIDKLSLEKASFQRKLTCKPTAFALVAPEFAFDPEWKVPAPAGGLVGQVLYFRLRII